MNKNKFTKNSKYFTITVYAVVGFLICALIVRVVFDFSKVWDGIKVLIGVLSPFVIGTILAYLINPMFKFFDVTFFGKWLHMKKRRNLRKTLSLVISYLVVFGIITALIYVIVPQFVESVKTLVGNLSGYTSTVEKWLSDVQQHFQNLNLAFLTDKISTIVPSILENAQEWSEGLLSGVVSTSVGVVSGIIKFVLSIFVSIYILSDKMKLEKKMRNLYYAFFKKDKAAKISKMTRECSNIFSNFFTGKIFDSLIVGILCGIFMLILGLPYPLMISVIIGVTNIIPYFGPFIGTIPSVLIMLMSGWKEALIFVAMILVIQQIDGALIGPKILGQSTGLSPIWVLFAITLGGWVGGVLGMLFGVPVMAVIGHITEELLNNRLERKGLTVMVERDEAPQTLNYSDLIRNIFSKKKRKEASETEEGSEEKDESVTKTETQAETQEISEEKKKDE